MTDSLQKWFEALFDSASNQIKPLLNRTIDLSNSIKTNFISTKTNFVRLEFVLMNLISYVREVKDSIKIESLTANIFEQFESQKCFVTIDRNLNAPGSFITKQIGKRLFRIDRGTGNETNKFTITLDGELWNTDNLMVFVKQIDGTVVYPVIKTNENKVDIWFGNVTDEGIPTNYNVYFV